MQQVLGEGLQQHLVVFGTAFDQRAGDTSGGGVFQYRVDVRIANAAFQIIALELQLDHGQILDVNAQQVNARAALDHVRLTTVAALQFALIEGRDVGAHCRQRGIRGVRRLFHAKIVLLGLRDLTLKVVDVTGPIEQVWVLHIEPERATGVALAGGQPRQSGTIASGHLKHRLRSSRVPERDAGPQLGGHPWRGLPPWVRAASG